MKRTTLFIVLAMVLMGLFPQKALAQPPYTIERFISEVVINQDASITVEERIVVNFTEKQHGIFRKIPTKYAAGDQKVIADFDLIEVVDGSGGTYQTQLSNLGDVVEIRIGNPDKYVEGEQVYVIRYRMGGILQRFEEHDELYWNVTGSDWDAPISYARVMVSSPYAQIVNSECYTGLPGSREKLCSKSPGEDSLTYISNTTLGQSADFTVVVGLTKDSQIIFPVERESILKKYGVVAYVFSILPLAFIGYFWWKKGRDVRYLGDNIYYEPDEKTTRTVLPFERKHLPLVYHPIDNLTPSEVGAIIDEKIDIQDVVAEISELARLGYLTIIKEKGRKKFTFKRTKKTKGDLKEHQSYLLEKLFLDGDEVKLSELKNKFYKHLDEFKNKLYLGLNEKVFAGSPDKVRMLWVFLYVLVSLFALAGVVIFTIATENPFPILLLVILFIPGIFFAINMPKRTARGYAYLRQIEGLKWYLNKGKWRHEIAEKKLFFEEMLPLAVSLGVVNKLAREMKDLGVEPPSYITGVTTSTLSADIRSFNSVVASNLSSNPSGGSTWSGGSGFSGGGSSGGGFGGGGGGSW